MPRRRRSPNKANFGPDYRMEGRQEVMRDLRQGIWDLGLVPTLATGGKGGRIVPRAGIAGNW